MWNSRVSVVVVFLLLAVRGIAQQRVVADPYQSYDCFGPGITQVPGGGPTHVFRTARNGPSGQPRAECGDWLLFVAELMKGVGDYRASSKYREAVAADQFEAAYSFLLWRIPEFQGAK
jgi:hypothetical protein